MATDKPQPATPSHLLGRVRALQRRARRWAADALLVTNPPDIRYLTGFTGDDSWLLVRQKAATVHVLSDFRFEQQIQRSAPHVVTVMRKRTLAEALASLCRRLRVGRVGLQADYVTLAQRRALVKRLGARSLVTVDDGLLDQRAVKGPQEVSAISRAIRIQEQAFRKTLVYIRPGRTEIQIAAHLEYQMRQLGSEGPSFPTVVAVGSNASLPHAVPSPRKVRDRSLVLIDWGATFKGYCGDLTRTIAVGRMSSKMRRVYALVLEAQRAAIDAITPGKTLAEIDKVARNIIEAAGYGPQFGHSLGHGIGLSVHEQPVLSKRAKGVLEPGHVVTVEPGIYLPGSLGVRIEDDVLVTDRGRRVLSKLPTDLRSAII